jgi:hypothetical protein
MPCRRLAGLLVAILTTGGLVSCSEDEPVAPDATHHMPADVAAAAALDPFTFRAPLRAHHIQQGSNFLIDMKARSDFIIQRSMFTGTGAWHTHPGLSYAYVIEGRVKLQKFTKEKGCFETRVYNPGDVYIKPPNQLHRAIVVSEEPEWELIVRLNFPIGGPIAVPADDPGC